jgi:putative transposase
MWQSIEPLLPINHNRTGRPRAENHLVLNAIWFVLWSGSQWKAIERHWFGVSSSVIHERFQSWGRQGVFGNILKAMLHYYHRQARMHWTWQSLDSKAVASPLGGGDTGKNPTDRAKLGSKIHILVDQQGLPLSFLVTGANENDKWYVEALVLSILLKRPATQQYLGADKAYDSWDVHLFVKQHRYIPHIKHRRRVNDPPEECPSRVNIVIRLVVGWWNEPSVGWSSVEAIGPAGARNLKIGYPSFNSLVLTLPSIRQFSDRLLGK